MFVDIGVTVGRRAVKIVYVSSLGLTGPSIHMVDLAMHVSLLGHEVEVVCGTDELCRLAHNRGLVARTEALRHKLDLLGARRVVARFAGADVVHTHDRRAGFFTRVTARSRPALSVHTLHGLPDEIAMEVGREARPLRAPDVSLMKEMWARYFTIRAEGLLAHIGALVVPSRALRDWLVTHGFPSRRMKVIPYGVPLLADVEVASHRPLRIATAAHLDHRKGVDVLIEACALSKSALRLDVFGEGPDRAWLEQRARSLRVETVWHGFVPDFRSRRADYDVFVLATRGDNLPVAILEAMAVAAPVIATRVGGIPEQIVHEKTGLLVSPEDPDALARAIDRLASDPKLRKTLGSAGHRRAAELFDPGRIAREMLDFYAEQLARENAA